jgi:ATP-dependent DNA helicase RecQ
LAAIAEVAPQMLVQLQGISELGVKKLDPYGPQVLWVCNGVA